MVIYFFKERSKELIDFYDLVDGYFDKCENTSITSNDNELIINFDIPNFACSYRYLVTKRSRVTSMYRLNPNYMNTFMLCEIPEAIPQFLIRYILRQVEELCTKFGFAIYHDMFDNIHEFNMFEMIALLTKERKNYLQEHPEVVMYPIDQDMLNEICTYQASLSELPKIVKGDVVASPYIVLKDSSNHIYFSVNWQVGLPTTFPPHLDFVHVEEEVNLVSLVPANIFYKNVDHYMYEIKDGSIDIRIKYLNEKGSNKARKLIRKMRKYVVSAYDYEEIKLTNLIEK